MNSLYSLGVRQTSSLNNDLDTMANSAETSASLQGESSSAVRPSQLSCLHTDCPPLSTFLDFWDPLVYVAVPGQIAASLAALSRTIEDYDSLARKEMIAAKQEKALA